MNDVSCKSVFDFIPHGFLVRMIRKQLVFSNENALEARNRCRITRLVLVEQIGGGIFRIRGSRVSRLQAPSPLVSNTVLAIFADADRA